MVPELVAVGCDVPVPDDVVGGGGRTIGCDEAETNKIKIYKL